MNCGEKGEEEEVVFSKDNFGVTWLTLKGIFGNMCNEDYAVK